MPSVVKELMMKEMKQGFEKNSYAFVSSLGKVTVADIADYRRSIEKVASRSLMVKHTFARKIFQEMKYEGAEKLLNGSVLVTFGNKDPQVISKAIVDFCKTNNKFNAAGVIFESKVYDQEFMKQLAALPSRKELLTQVVVRVKSPISGFVMTLSAVMRGFVVALNEVKKKREAAPAAA
ncbi:MAG TPA: 50S ribosomal protein L10 [Verrucomicrobiae bacterium]|jgi:large subunit ribosomal protein L10|nr:50S ribosomal protein L10 [Verrucomicrobiae bacterium]